MREIDSFASSKRALRAAAPELRRSTDSEREVSQSSQATRMRQRKPS
jgi:hypothetical protein